MSIFKRIANLFRGGRPANRMQPIYAYSNRCREAVVGSVDLFNELSLLAEEEGASEHAYYVRKVLHTSGENRCFDQVEVEIWFDKNKQIAAQEVTGGRWLTEEEYQQEKSDDNQ